MELLGRLRSDRVMHLPAPPRGPGTNGRPRKHGRELALADPAACPDPQVTTSTATSRYGTAAAAAWDRVHPRLTHRARLARPRRAAAGHRGHPDPAASGPPARRPGPQAGLAVVVPHRRHAGRCGPVLAVVLAPIRPGAHLPAVQADPGLDRAEDPRPGRRGPVDLADHRRLRPAPPGPPRSPPTCACPGNAPHPPGGSPRPASAADSGTSARPSPARPVRRNPASPAQDGRQGQRTAAPQPAMTWGKPPKGNSRSRQNANAQVKRQAKNLSGYSGGM